MTNLTFLNANTSSSSPIRVTSTADSGAGTLRDALEVQTGPRYISVETVTPIILTSELSVTGQTGITIVGRDGASVEGARIFFDQCTNLYISRVAFKLGAVVPDHDCLALVNCSNISITECAFFWSIDELLDLVGTSNAMITKCVFAEPLQDAGHASGSHAYAARLEGDDILFQDNLIASQDFRPTLQGKRIQYDRNLQYNAGSSYPVVVSEPAAGGGTYDITNNVFRTGPSTAIQGPSGYRTIKVFDSNPANVNASLYVPANNWCDSRAFGHPTVFGPTVVTDGGVSYTNSMTPHVADLGETTIDAIYSTWQFRTLFDDDARRVRDYVFTNGGSVVDLPPT